MRESARTYLRQLADAIESAERYGAPEDVPEGARHIVLVSDTLARQLARELREIAEECAP